MSLVDIICCMCVYYLGDGATDRPKSLHDGRAVSDPERFCPLFVAISLAVSKWAAKKESPVDHFWPLRHRYLSFDRKYLENGKSQRYM